MLNRYEKNRVLPRGRLNPSYLSLASSGLTGALAFSIGTWECLHHGQDNTSMMLALSELTQVIALEGLEKLVTHYQEKTTEELLHDKSTWHDASAIANKTADRLYEHILAALITGTTSYVLVKYLSETLR